jgi:AcrR family transcriptional regulator
MSVRLPRVSSYHHGNLRESLIVTGIELARAQGPDGVVLREVARRAGVSHNAAYRHFADREALLAEIARHGMRELHAAMQREIDAADAEDHPDEQARAAARLRATGRAYVDFAVAEPGLFDIAFTAIPDEDGLDAAADPYDLLTQVLDDAVAAGVVSADLRPGAEVICWAAVHGFATLHVHGPRASAPVEERNATLEVMLDHIARGLA